MMLRFLYSLSFLLVVLAGSAVAAKPHVILILADDLGFNDVGFQGNSQMPTPILNRLASMGVTLKDQYVTPWCSPTRASILTGRYPMRYGLQHIVVMPQRPFGLPLDEKLLPEYLKSKGYSNHLIGKWHLGMYKRDYLPTRRGFDTFYGTYHNVNHTSHEKTVSNADVNCNTDAPDARGARSQPCEDLFMQLANCELNAQSCESVYRELHAAGCGTGTDVELDDSLEEALEAGLPLTRDDLPPTFTGKSWQRDTPTDFQRVNNPNLVFSSADIAQEALTILDAHDIDDPLFMMLAFTAVHAPIMVDEQHHSDCDRYPHPPRSALCTMVRGMDDAVGQVVDKLIDKKMYENSIIIFFSDNGGEPFQSSNHPFKGQKSSLLQGGVRVPSFIHAPNRLEKPGIEKEGYIHAVDWFTTIKNLADGEEDNEYSNVEAETDDKVIDGMDMWKFLSKENEQSPRHEILLNIDPLCIKQPKQPKYSVGPYASLISDDWKYYEGDPGSPFLGDCFLGDGNTRPNATDTYLCPFPLYNGVALVNLKDDPYEELNVAEHHSDVVEELRAKMDNYRSEMVDPLWPDPDPRADPRRYDGWWTPWE